MISPELVELFAGILMLVFALETSIHFFRAYYGQKPLDEYQHESRLVKMDDQLNDDSSLSSSELLEQPGITKSASFLWFSEELQPVRSIC
jgi:hypothetical protein